jgi:photosystem II stability/assembly factor-like uncharacterized protein
MYYNNIELIPHNLMKKVFTLNNLTSLLFYLAILIFIIGFNFMDSPPPSGWYQQFMPNLGGRQIKDITFLDSLIGYAITSRLSSTDTSFILKTTDGGDNWAIIHGENSIFTRVQFLNQSTGFVGGSIYMNYLFYILKTTNGGINWFIINAPLNQTDMAVLNEETIWLVSDNGLSGGIYNTTNGGQNWDWQFSQYNNNPNKIYMYNREIGFACTSGQLLRTSNSGQNWTQIGGTSETNSFRDMYFIDSLTGWKTSIVTQPSDSNISKTTNGGLNWINQHLPSGGYISMFGRMTYFANVNRDTIWGGGGYLLYPNNQYRGILYRTTNGGNDWLFQIPDTSFKMTGFLFVNFINKNVGWSYLYQNGIHTITGGDSIFYYGIQKIGSEVPKNFILKQNYPNPFNPRTVIPYSLKSAGYVRIIAYDILGREVQRMVDNYQQAGEYEVDFMGKFSATGVYFYRMTVDEPLSSSGHVFMETKKMVLLK